MSRNLPIVLFGIFAGFVAGWFVAHRRIQRAFITAPAPSADSGEAVLDCDHARDDQWRSIWNTFYMPMKKAYLVEWQVCLGEIEGHRVRVIDGNVVSFQYRDDAVDRIEIADLLGDHKPQLFILTSSQGTADATTWHFLDESNGKLREWKEPNYDEPAKKLLRPDEHFCCKSWGLGLRGREVSIARPIYRKGDANCCPSRGGVIVHLKPGPGAFNLTSINRLSKSQYDGWLARPNWYGWP
jgi:hypothetical protein